MNGGVCLIIDIDKTRLEKRVEIRYLGEIADDVEAAIERVLKAKSEGVPLWVGVVGNAAVVVPQLLCMDVPIDIVTDQTSAHDALSYVPIGVDFHEAAQLAKDDPKDFTKRAREVMAKHVEAMVGFIDKGAEVFDYGNFIRDEARQGGFARAFAFPGFVPAPIVIGRDHLDCGSVASPYRETESMLDVEEDD
jgi:urocanate hydratase